MFTAALMYNDNKLLIVHASMCNLFAVVATITNCIPVSACIMCPCTMCTTCHAGARRCASDHSAGTALPMVPAPSCIYHTSLTAQAHAHTVSNCHTLCFMQASTFSGRLNLQPCGMKGTRAMWILSWHLHRWVALQYLLGSSSRMHLLLCNLSTINELHGAPWV